MSSWLVMSGTCTAQWVSAERLNTFFYLIIKLKRISSNPYGTGKHRFGSGLFLASELKLKTRWWVILWL